MAHGETEPGIEVGRLVVVVHRACCCIQSQSKLQVIMLFDLRFLVDASEFSVNNAIARQLFASIARFAVGISSLASSL